MSGRAPAPARPVAEATSRRRERRIPLRQGSFVEFPHPGQDGTICRAAIVDVSISGLAVELGPEAAPLEPGTRLGEMKITIGWCDLRGELLVRNVWTVDGNAVRAGGIFYPESEEVEQRLMVLISGLEAAKPI